MFVHKSDDTQQNDDQSTDGHYSNLPIMGSMYFSSM
jgi:hypothetical protein